MNPIEADGPLGLPAHDTALDLSPGRIVGQCQSALLELERRDCIVWRVEGYSAIDQARNQIASDALEDGFQETLWIDSDVGFDPNDVERIRRHGLPIVCGIYPKKGKRELAIPILPGTPSLRFGVHGGLHELLYGGTGFLHVRRSVYETMIERLGLPVCNEHAKRPLWPFFLPLVRCAPANGVGCRVPVIDEGRTRVGDTGHNRDGAMGTQPASETRGTIRRGNGILRKILRSVIVRGFVAFRSLPTPRCGCGILATTPIAGKMPVSIDNASVISTFSSLHKTTLLVPGLPPWNAMPGGSCLHSNTNSAHSRKAGALLAVRSEAGASERDRGVTCGR